MAVTKYWNLFDPFGSQKLSTWRSSAAGAAALAKSLQKLVQEGPVDDEKKLKLDLLGMLEVDLWGNATDLSLLTSLTHEEIQQLQSVARGQHFVLKNDFERTWEHFKAMKDARVDIVLDNSGFELYTDLVLADWLVTLSPYVSEVVFHPKLVPWFVSDVCVKSACSSVVGATADPARVTDNLTTFSSSSTALTTLPSFLPTLA